jgi:hypothetical protein
VTDLQARLRDDLAAAMRAQDRSTVRLLRTVLSAIANAEAQPVEGATRTSRLSSGPIAGATTGVGATEVGRRDLGEDEVRAIVRAERGERITAADDLAGRGLAAAAADLVTEATLLDRYLT